VRERESEGEREGERERQREREREREITGPRVVSLKLKCRGAKSFHQISDEEMKESYFLE